MHFVECIQCLLWPIRHSIDRWWYCLGTCSEYKRNGDGNAQGSRRCSTVRYKLWCFQVLASIGNVQRCILTVLRLDGLASCRQSMDESSFFYIRTGHVMPIATTSSLYCTFIEKMCVYCAVVENSIPRREDCFFNVVKISSILSSIVSGEIVWKQSTFPVAVNTTSS